MSLWGQTPSRPEHQWVPVTCPSYFILPHPHDLHWLCFPCAAVSRPLLTPCCLHGLPCGFSVYTWSHRCGTVGSATKATQTVNVGCSSHHQAAMVIWQTASASVFSSGWPSGLLPIWSNNKKSCSKCPCLSLFDLVFSMEGLPCTIRLCLPVQETAMFGVRPGGAGCHLSSSGG